MKRMGLLLFCAMGVACTRVAPMAPVTVVHTRTPGVAFVVVRPTAKSMEATKRVQPHDGKPIDPTSQYILLCDARPVDGMRCSIPTEASIARYSYTPRSSNAAVPVDEGVGTLADLSTHVSREKEPEDNAAPAAGDVKASAPAGTEATPAASGNSANSAGKEGQK